MGHTAAQRQSLTRARLVDDESHAEPLVLKGREHTEISVGKTPDALSSAIITRPACAHEPLASRQEQRDAAERRPPGQQLDQHRRGRE